jgi:hypothetical protein
MDNRDCLAFYPFVVVRIACRVCSRSGSYRLARLAAKFGPEITLRDLMDRFAYDCLWCAEARSKAGKSACGVYLPDLEQPRPPDMPPGMVKLRLVKGPFPRFALYCSGVTCDVIGCYPRCLRLRFRRKKSCLSHSD